MDREPIESREVASEPRPPAAPGAWAHLRAALVTAHLVAIFLAAVPGPEGGLNRQLWSDPSVQSELAVWARRFGTTQQRFSDAIYPLAEAFSRGRERVLALVRPYITLTGCDQPWRLFVAPDRVPSRFHLELYEAPRGWRTLYEEGSSEFSYRRDFYTHPRLRRALYWYGWPPSSGARGQHCRWVAGQVFREQPDARAVRCRFYRAPSPSPEEAAAGRRPAGAWGQETIVWRPAAAQGLAR